MKPSASWRRLDNAAKIFPSNSTVRDPKVFRFTCELTQEIEPMALQLAAERTAQEFPFFRFTLRHGFFWYYLEDTQSEVQVAQENETPCQPLYIDSSSALFRVSYWKTRINLEVYHAVTDGTGAMEFLRTMVCYYLRHVHEDALRGTDLALGVDASAFQRMGDGFDKYYTGVRAKRGESPRAFRIKGERFAPGTLRVIIGDVPVDALLAAARSRNITLTVLIAACLVCAVCDEMPMRDQKHPVVITIPVNLRKYFESETARNFFSIITLAVDFRNTPNQFDKVAQALKAEMDRKLTREALQTRMNALAWLEHNPLTRILPLALKDPAMHIAGRISDNASTVSLSNVGRAEMPQALHPYIRKFDVFIATAGVQMCSCSFNNTMSLAFTSSFQATDIERGFFSRLTAMGLPVVISTNLPLPREEES